jgi:uncharacterized OsmC-like protein
MIIMSEEERLFSVSLKREEGYIFKVDLGIIDVDDLVMDEPEPLGKNVGPNASKVLAAAMGNCLSASLLFCLQKARVEVGDVFTKVEGKTRRNEKGRWRIAEINVEIRPELDLDTFQNQYDRCLSIFEDFCIVSKSIEEGIPINLNVKPT